MTAKATKMTAKSPARLPRMDVTYSMFRSFQTCPRKCYWHYIQQIESVKRSDALDVGTFFHEFMEEKSETFEWSELEDPHWTEREEENYTKAKAMYDAYKHAIGYDMRARYTNVGSEQTFRIPIRTSNGGQSKTYMLTGKIDGMVQDKKTGEYWLVEHKTTSRVDGAYLDKLALDLQIMIYMMAARQVWPDKQPVGVIYNIVQKPTVKRLGITKTREEVEPLWSYGDRMFAQYAEHPDWVSQHQIHFSNRDLEDVAVELGMWADHLTACRHTNQWPRNTGQCHTVYGTCPFLPLCQGNMMDADIYMGTLYQRKDGMHSELNDSSADANNDANDIDNMVF